MHFNKFIGLTGMILFITAAAIFAQENQDSTKKMQQLYMEYQQIRQQLQIIQQKALNDPEFAEESKRFSKKLDSAMIKANPSDKEKIAKRDKILSNIRKAQLNGNNEKFQKLQKDYKTISMQLMSHQQKVMENGKLHKEANELNNELIKKMTKIDSGVPKLIDRLKFLGEKLQQGMK